VKVLRWFIGIDNERYYFNGLFKKNYLPMAELNVDDYRILQAPTNFIKKMCW
jgi:hypothetical protein